MITRDKKIRYRPVEKRAWVTRQVRGFVLTGRSSQATADSLVILEIHWTAISTIVTENPQRPWMFSLTSAAVRPIPLE